MENKAAVQKRWINSPKGILYLSSKSHKESIQKYNRKRDREHRDITQRKVRVIKLLFGCMKCGYKDHFAALEFHHRDLCELKSLNYH